jgi:16S rRNA (adenine1518-N6/adenine1519-N6)-dimethyltransferase
MNEKHRAKKSLGQNFLKDENIIAQIIQYVSPGKSQHFIEVGPGLGALTKAILPFVGSLDAIEFDKDVIPELEKACKEKGVLRIHQADALKFDFSTLIKGADKARVIGNLPYNISTPLLFHLITFSKKIQDMHFMLQKEVVDRICASLGTKRYGRLTVMLQYYCKAEFLFEVPPEAFTPKPKVDSAILRLVPYDRPPYPAKNMETLSIVVRTAFNQRRKTLRNTLKSIISEEELQALGIDPKQRPEQTSLKAFVDIANFKEAL